MAEPPEKVAPLRAVGFVLPDGPFEALSALEGEILHHREYRAEGAESLRCICYLPVELFVANLYVQSIRPNPLTGNTSSRKQSPHGT